MIVTYKKILLTHDGSKLADLALSHAVSLAREYQAEISVLQVVESFKFNKPLAAPEGPITIQKEALEHMVKNEIKAAKVNVNHIKKILKEGVDTNITTVVKEGNAINEIIDYVKSNNIDIIVMATHGRTGLKKVVLGSVADNVLRNVSCPLLLISAKSVLKKA